MPWELPVIQNYNEMLIARCKDGTKSKQILDIFLLTVFQITISVPKL